MNEDIMMINIPKEVADIKLPDPDLLRYYKNVKNRIIYVDYIIDEDFLQLVGNQIIDYNIQDKGKPVEERKPIVILINSGGGNLDTAYAVIAIMQSSKTPIITVNTNCAYSAAGLVLMAGHRRYCMPRSQVLIHSGSAQGISGNYEDIQESTKSYKKMVEEMREFIISNTKIDKALMKKNQARDWYLDTTSQIELGCADSILTNLDEIIF